jgi:hypothetical protein
MERRLFIGALVCAALAGCDQSTSKTAVREVAVVAPDKIKLSPDAFDLRHVGRLEDGRGFWVDSQLDYAGGKTTDFVCTFVFDADGSLRENTIERIGVRGLYPDGSVGKALDRHLAKLGKTTIADIWVRLFKIDSNGSTFGLIPRHADDCGWRVDFMPGNTLSFYPPWNEGGFDT